MTIILCDKDCDFRLSTIENIEVLAILCNMGETFLEYLKEHEHPEYRVIRFSDAWHEWY